MLARSDRRVEEVKPYHVQEYLASSTLGCFYADNGQGKSASLTAFYHLMRWIWYVERTGQSALANYEVYSLADKFQGLIPDLVCGIRDKKHEHTPWTEAVSDALDAGERDPLDDSLAAARRIYDGARKERDAVSLELQRAKLRTKDKAELAPVRLKVDAAKEQLLSAKESIAIIEEQIADRPCYRMKPLYGWDESMVDLVISGRFKAFRRLLMIDELIRIASIWGVMSKRMKDLTQRVQQIRHDQNELLGCTQFPERLGSMFSEQLKFFFLCEKYPTPEGVPPQWVRLSLYRNDADGKRLPRRAAQRRPLKSFAIFVGQAIYDYNTHDENRGERKYGD